MNFRKFAEIIADANDQLAVPLSMELQKRHDVMKAVIDLRALGDGSQCARRRVAIIRTHETELVFLELDSEWYRPFFWDDEATPELVASKMLEISRNYGLGRGLVASTRRGLLRKAA